jgi:hypothetical protein
MEDTRRKRYSAIPEIPVPDPPIPVYVQTGIPIWTVPESHFTSRRVCGYVFSFPVPGAYNAHPFGNFLHAELPDMAEFMSGNVLGFDPFIVPFFTLR